MVKGVLRAGSEAHLVDQLGLDEVVHRWFDAEAGQKVDVETQSYDRGRTQRALGFGRKTIDPGGDGGLQRGRHTDVGDVLVTHVRAALPAQHAALTEITNDLLREERVARGAR